MYAELTSRSVSSELVSTRPSHAFNVTLCTPCTVSHKLRHKRPTRRTDHPARSRTHRRFQHRPDEPHALTSATAAHGTPARY